MSLHWLAAVSTPLLSRCGLTVASSTGSTRATDVGVFAYGGILDFWTDPGESLEVRFEEPVSHVAYSLDEESGDHFVEAFDGEDVSLGIRSVSDAIVDLSQPQRFGDAPIGRVVLTAADPYRLRTVSFLPEPAGAPLAAVAALGWAAGGRRRLR